MPLHGDDEIIPGRLDSLDEAVGIASAGDQPLADPVDSLVVVALHRRARANQTSQPAARHGPHRGGGEHRIAPLVISVAKQVRQMLVQAAPHGHIEHLGPAANAQHRHAAPQRSTEKCELPGVAVTGGLIGGRVRLIVVGGGIDVTAAGEDQPVETVKHPRGDLGVDGLRWEQGGDPAPVTASR